jgi:ABC-type transport system substrate-binding protein
MKLRILGITMVLMIAMMAASITTVESQGTFEKFGPRVNDIIFRVAGGLSGEATDFEAGNIDFMDWAVPADKIDAWLANSAMILEDYSEAGWYEYDLNLQMWPIGHGSMDPTLGALGGAAPTADMNWNWKNIPSWDAGHYWIDDGCQRCQDSKLFRKALATLTDRNSLSSAYPGSLTPMETFIFPTIGGWKNLSAPKYPYSVANAKALLDQGGFKDYDGDLRREYCKHVAARNAWDGNPAHAPPDVEEIPDIQLWRRTDDPPRNTAGELLRDALAACFVFVDDHPGTYSTCTPHAWKDYDYHIYTGGWGWATVPDMYYECWNSEKDIYPNTDGDNYNRYHRQTYDTLSYDFKTSATAAAALPLCKDCQAVIHDDVACIPLYTMAGYVAHRKSYKVGVTGEGQYGGLEWQGFVNEQGFGYYGGNFGFSSLNAHPAGYERGGTIRHGLIDIPAKIDPLDSESFYEAQIISKIYEPLIVRNPVDAANYIPWMVDSFQEGTWINEEGDTCSKVTVTLSPGVLFHDNLPVTPEDVEFSYAYKKAAKAVSESTVLKEYHDCVINGNTIEIRYNSTSFLALSWVGGTAIIPKHIWEAYPPTLPGNNTIPGSWSFDPEAENKLIGTGAFRCYKDEVIGKLDISSGRDYIHLSANPTYHRKVVRPDFAKPPAGPGQTVQPVADGNIDGADFGMTIGKFGDKYTPPWEDPTWDPRADVNKDFKLDLDDIMETGVRYGKTGCHDGYPPEYI